MSEDNVDNTKNKPTTIDEIFNGFRPSIPIQRQIVYSSSPLSSSYCSSYCSSSSSSSNKVAVYIVQRKMYYDKDEREFGDGFYPQLREMKGGYFSIIKFRISTQYPNIWNQINDCPIYGLDGDTGKELLDSLNSDSPLIGNCISNSGGRIIYPYNYRDSTHRIINSYQYNNA
jgi:hypothetical protein